MSDGLATPFPLLKPNGKVDKTWAETRPNSDPASRTFLRSWEPLEGSQQIADYADWAQGETFLAPEEWFERVDAEPVARASELELPGEIALFREIMKDWNFDHQQAGILLGYDGPFVRDLFGGCETLRQRDANDRVRLVIETAADLDTLYRDPKTIQGWFHMPQKMLDGATPLRVLMEGSMDSLVRVREYVEYLSGR